MCNNAYADFTHNIPKLGSINRRTDLKKYLWHLPTFNTPSTFLSTQ